MSESLTKSHGATLARRFYDEHQDQFSAAAKARDVKDKYFMLTVGELDGWLVSCDQLDAPADSYESATKERRGTTLLRNTARQRINSAALRSEDHPPYAIGPNKGGKIHVRLIELYAQEAPGEIAHRINVSTRHHKRQINSAVKTLHQSSYVRDVDRAAMTAFSRFMVPMLEAFNTGIQSAIGSAERKRKRAAKIKTAASKRRK